MQMAENQRNSSFELLRISSIYGIICLHAFGEFYSTASGGNQLFGAIINSVFNMGVSIFMLISGYFGIRRTVRKAAELERTILLYSIADLICQVIIGNLQTMTKFDASVYVVKSVLPVLCGKYWYMSSYMILLILSPYINRIPDILSQKSFLRLIAVFTILFSVAPTLFYAEIMKDSGKGVLNMFLLYLIGRYIRKYSNAQTNVKITWMVLAGALMVGISGNCFLTLMKKDGGLFCPFGRDLSFTILTGSISLFLLFRKWNFRSCLVNAFARCTFGIYLSEGIARGIIQNYFWDIGKYENAVILPFIILLYALLIMFICGGVDYVIRKILGIHGLQKIEAGIHIIQSPVERITEIVVGRCCEEEK